VSSEDEGEEKTPAGIAAWSGRSRVPVGEWRNGAGVLPDARLRVRLQPGILLTGVLSADLADLQNLAVAEALLSYSFCRVHGPLERQGIK